MGEIAWPAELRVNAWDGQGSPVEAPDKANHWGLRQRADAGSLTSLAAPVIDEKDWFHPAVGWGLILKDNDAVDARTKARGEDAPEALQKLLAARINSPVLRYRNDIPVGKLRRYYEDGTASDLDIASSARGVAPRSIPKYLLIYGAPADIPWSLQFTLNMRACVGRLDLTGDALSNYVEALINGFGAADANAPLVWNVDLGKPDITWLMSRVIGEQLFKTFEKDNDLVGRKRLCDADATIDNLKAAIKAERPGLIVTTSHGMTGPLNDAARLRAALGNLVDLGNHILDGSDAGDWQPAGAIWYAHACCSAGSESPSLYGGLVSGPVGGLVTGVAAAAGAMTAPLPNALLGASAPLRAFVGHVEPTFDWTLRSPDTGQVLAHGIVDSLWQQLYTAGKRMPIGLALKQVYQEAATNLSAWADALSGVNQGVAGATTAALYYQLVALDRRGMVILGDPTVTLPG
jgi:hypothetical protein